MAGKFRKGFKHSLLALGTALGIYTGVAMTEARDHDERTATITYGQLQDIVASDNPIITHLDISLMRGKRDFEEFVTLALGDEVDFSDRPPRYPALFDRTLRDQVELHHQAMRQEECTNDMCYPHPPTAMHLIDLAARITDSNLEYDHEAHFIHHTEQAFDNDNTIGGIVEFIIRSGEVGIEYAHVSSMAPDEIINYGKGMCEQYSDLFNATLRRLNEMFGSPYDFSVGTIASAPGNPSSAFYEGLSRLLNLYYFHRNSGFVPHVSNIVIAHDPHRLNQPRIYFVDPQGSDPFVNEDQIISVNREQFSRFSAALTLAEDYSVRAYSRRHDFNSDGSLWDHIVVDDDSVRILTEDLGLREDVITYIREHTDPSVLTLPEIGLLRLYEGEVDAQPIIDHVGEYGWLASRLRASMPEGNDSDLILPDSDVCAGVPMDAGVFSW